MSDKSHATKMEEVLGELNDLHAEVRNWKKLKKADRTRVANELYGLTARLQRVADGMFKL